MAVKFTAAQKQSVKETIKSFKNKSDVTPDVLARKLNVESCTKICASAEFKQLDYEGLNLLITICELVQKDLKADDRIKALQKSINALTRASDDAAKERRNNALIHGKNLTLTLTLHFTLTLILTLSR